MFSGNLYVRNKLTPYSQKSHFITNLNKYTKIMSTLCCVSFCPASPCHIISIHLCTQDRIPSSPCQSGPADSALYNLSSSYYFQPQAPEALICWQWKLIVPTVPLSNQPPPIPHICLPDYLPKWTRWDLYFLTLAGIPSAASHRIAPQSFLETGLHYLRAGTISDIPLTPMSNALHSTQSRC